MEAGARWMWPGGSTSKKDARKAGKKLAAKSCTKAQKSAAASDLAQAKRPTGRTSKKKKWAAHFRRY